MMAVAVMIPAIGIWNAAVTVTETENEIERETVIAIVPLTETVIPEEKEGNPECFHLFQVRPVAVRNSYFK